MVMADNFKKAKYSVILFLKLFLIRGVLKKTSLILFIYYCPEVGNFFPQVVPSLLCVKNSVHSVNSKHIIVS